MKSLVRAVAAAVAVLVAGGGYAAEDQIAYPFGYRNWHHVKSMVLKPNHPLANPFAGLHHVYANPKAVQGLKSGTYPDGAIIVFDLLEAKDASDNVQEGGRKLIGVMVRDAAKYAATGGWGWEAFAGDSRGKRLVTDGGKSCFDCHKSEEKTQYVFSRPRN